MRLQSKKLIAVLCALISHYLVDDTVAHIFNKKKLVHLDDLNVIINRYSELLNKNETKIVSHNGIRMLRVPSNRFQIKLVDKSKSNLDEDTYFNLGYFANFKEDGLFFTLPVANLVADTDENTLSSPCLKYLKERKVKDNKVYFYASQNASDQFKTKDVSTLIICNDNTVFIDKYNSLYDEDVNPSSVELEIFAPYGVSYNREGESFQPALNYTGFLSGDNGITQGLNLYAIPKVLDIDIATDEVTIGLSVILQSLYYAGYRVASAGKIVTPKGSIVSQENSDEMKFVCGNLLNLAIKPLDLSPPHCESSLKNDCDKGCQPVCEENLPQCLTCSI